MENKEKTILTPEERQLKEEETQRLVSFFELLWKVDQRNKKQNKNKE